jgi:hypothetical protein
MFTGLGDEKRGWADIHALLMTMYNVDCDFCVLFGVILLVIIWSAFF